MKSLEDCAHALYAGGWRKEDLGQLMDCYGLTLFEAEAIVEKLEQIEETKINRRINQMKSLEACFIELVECHKKLKDFSPGQAEAYAIVIRSQLEKLLEAIKNDN